jgi:hypothetical protein
MFTYTKWQRYKEKTETLIHASREIGLEVNAEKTKYMLVSHLQTAGQNHDIKTANRSFKLWYTPWPSVRKRTIPTEPLNCGRVQISGNVSNNWKFDSRLN